MALHLILLVLSSLTVVSTCLASELELDQMEDQVTQSTELSAPEKRGFFRDIRRAREGFREWKRNTPNHSSVVREMKALKKAIHTPGTAEHQAIQDAYTLCQAGVENCSNAVTQAFSSITKASSASAQKTSIIPAPGIFTCGYDHNSDEDGILPWHFLVVGSASDCGMKYYGPGAAIAMAGFHGILCASQYPAFGVNAGFFAKAAAFFGAETALVFGENGVCISIGLQGAIGAAAGIVSIDLDEWETLSL